MLKTTKHKDKDGIVWCVCNNCDRSYELALAEIYCKGNEFFCSKECVLEYEKQFAQGEFLDGGYNI